MKVGLVQVDGKYPNLALMKLSAWHKAKGDQVQYYEPIDCATYDRVYMSKVFDFTPDYVYDIRATEVVKGGTGYDMKSVLPEEIEHTCPDYDAFNCSYAMGFTSRGCIRHCPFCVVPRKEGKARATTDIHEFWRGQTNLRLLDNNLTALPEHFEFICKQLIDKGIRTDFCQGLDIRLINDDMAQLLARVKLWKAIHFAFDNIKDEKTVRQGIEVLTRNGVKKDNLMFYVLIGYNSTPEEDLHRVEVLRGLNVMPFVMPFNKSDDYQRRFARWVNHKAIFKSTSWQDYKG